MTLDLIFQPLPPKCALNVSQLLNIASMLAACMSSISVTVPGTAIPCAYPVTELAGFPADGRPTGSRSHLRRFSRRIALIVWSCTDQ